MVFKTNCKKNSISPFLPSGTVAVLRDLKCCRCNKSITETLHDSDWSRAKQYPTEKEFGSL